MTTEAIARLRYRMARARHQRTRRSRNAPVVVFSMAKSGTTAVAAGLRQAGVHPVFHVHDLDRDYLTEEERQYQWSGRPWRIWDAQALLRSSPSPSAPWCVVSLVRDPIAQCISAFFQPGERRGYLRADATTHSLLAAFGDRLEHLQQLGWFETHIEPAFGIDVYATPFDRERRYQVIKTPSVKLLLLRFEDLAVAPEALADLVGRAEPIPLPKANATSDKPYGALYAAFNDALRPSEEVIDRAYASRLVRHFYTVDEIARFRALWSARGGPLSPLGQ